ncbi:MAG TPA: hypothetical protein VMU47_08170 [Caldimonas sp.]|nr:hypothetical protein [Caldimonas sp.]
MPDATALQFAPPEPQRDAADRLSRLHGALELKSALLALILPPSSQRAARAFDIETEGARQAPIIRDHVRNLPRAARLPWLEELLKRMALQPLGIRQDLLQSTRRVMGARGVARPIDRLHWLVMRRGLGEKPSVSARSAPAGDVSEWLDTDLLAIAAYTAFLSRMVPFERGDEGDEKAALAWYDLVIEPWRGGVPLPTCEPPGGEDMVRALSTLQTLSVVQRPLLPRGWVGAALKVSRRVTLADTAADALRLSCALLDTPMPPELERHYAGAAALPKPT